jgi:hypothetical protein
MAAAPSARTHIAQEVCLAVLGALKVRDHHSFNVPNGAYWICCFS